MTCNEFNILMDCLVILSRNNERRLKGFVIEWGPSCYAVVRGKIPLPLANMISSDLRNKLKICVGGGAEEKQPAEYANHQILEDFTKEFVKKLGTSNSWNSEDFQKQYDEKKAQLIADGRENEMYIERYHVYTIEGVKHVVECIREYNGDGCINEWAIGNK